MLNNNLTVVDEPVQVIVLFSKKPLLLGLSWRGKKIVLVKNNMFFTRKDKDKHCYFFYASDKNDNGYKLRFEIESMSWFLEQVTF